VEVDTLGERVGRVDDRTLRELVDGLLQLIG
jgi:hypothetical protein